MATGRSSKASKPGIKRDRTKTAGSTSDASERQAARATARTRTVVLNGTFSIKEIEVKRASRRKAAKTAKKKAVPKKGASPKKRAARLKTQKNVAARVKAVTKSRPGKKAVTAESGPVVLASSPGIRNIAELKDTLTAAYSATSTVVIDAGKVESIDTAALQLLVAFANSVREKSQVLEWKETSTAFREMANLADLSQCLGIGDDCVTEEDDGLCPVF